MTIQERRYLKAMMKRKRSEIKRKEREEIKRDVYRTNGIFIHYFEFQSFQTQSIKLKMFIPYWIQCFLEEEKEREKEQNGQRKTRKEHLEKKVHFEGEEEEREEKEKKRERRREGGEKRRRERELTFLTFVFFACSPPFNFMIT